MRRMVTIGITLVALILAVAAVAVAEEGYYINEGTKTGKYLKDGKWSEVYRDSSGVVRHTDTNAPVVIGVVTRASDGSITNPSGKILYTPAPARGAKPVGTAEGGG